MKVPAFMYPGGKAKLSKWLIDFVPKTGKRYVEPFAGRGNMMWRVMSECSYEEYWFNDIRTMGWLDAVLTADLDKLPETEEEPCWEWEKWRDRALAGDKVAILVCAAIAYSGGHHEHRGLSASLVIKGTRSFNYTKAGITSKCTWIRERSHRLRVSAKPYELVLAECGTGDFVYLDPPYVNIKVPGYSCKDLDHRELWRRLQSVPYSWLLSDYPNDIYGEPVALRECVHVPSSNADRHAGVAKRRVEAIWTNS